MSTSPLRLLFCADLGAGSRALRDAGHEVVVLAPGVTGEQLVAVAVQEDVDVVAVVDAELGAVAAASLGEAVVVFCITSAKGPS